MPLTTDKRNNTMGMATKSLRRHGFRRIKGKPVFARHTIGIGGVYVTSLVIGGYLVRIGDTKETCICKSVTALRKELERLDKIDEEEKPKWLVIGKLHPLDRRLLGTTVHLLEQGNEETGGLDHEPSPYDLDMQLGHYDDEPKEAGGLDE